MAKMKKGITAVGYAMATYDESNDKVNYAAVRYLPTNVAGGREYTADPRGESQKVYADSVAVYGDTVNDGYDINLTLLSAFDDQVNEDWLNEVIDEAGSAEYANGREFPYFALIVHEDTADGVGIRYIYYYCQASGRPSDSGKTREGGAFDFEYPQYPITSSARISDNLVRYKMPGKEKFETIPEPSGVKPAGTIELDKHYVLLASGGTSNLTPTVVPAGTAITWTAADSEVATVADGVVTAVGAGNTIITATITVDGVTMTDTCTIVVTA